MKKYIKSNATDPNYEPDIVLYVNNRRIYKGSPYSYELGYELTKLCMNTNVRESFIDWLVEIGLSADEFVYDETTPVDYMAQDVAGTVAEEIVFEYGEREDFYIDGMGCINLECFLAEDEVGASTKSTNKQYVKSNTNGRRDYSEFSSWKELDAYVVIDGEKYWCSKYKAYIDDYNTLMILPKYNSNTDTLCYELILYRGYTDMDIIEDQFMNPKEAMEYAETTLIPELIDNGVSASTKIMGSSWRAPNGKSYGKQTKRFPGKYLFTRKELKDMVDSGIAQDLGGTFDPMAMNYDIIGISWNESNGYRSGILIVDKDTGELYVGNSADANVAKL